MLVHGMNEAIPAGMGVKRLLSTCYCKLHVPGIYEVYSQHSARREFQLSLVRCKNPSTNVTHGQAGMLWEALELPLVQGSAAGFDTY